MARITTFEGQKQIQFVGGRKRRKRRVSRTKIGFEGIASSVLFSGKRNR